MGKYEVSDEESGMLASFFKGNENRRGTQDLKKNPVKMYIVDILGCKRAQRYRTNQVQQSRAVA